ncbi:hypothetical protein SUGI_0483600 [Cryptomeria japonica]|nr:hypothetical protein SUGI_0483600 [Cryptomeria japonica]
MEGNLISVVAGDEEQRGISELPLHLMEIIFKELPLISISHSRLVCKEWNEILSSCYFLSSLLKQDPWLLIFGRGNCMAYCFSIQNWKPISLSFLPTPLRNEYMLSSTALGLLAFRETPQSSSLETPPPPSLENSKLYLCNPLMRIYFPTKIEATRNPIHIFSARNGEPYLVMMLDEYHSKIAFRIYHFCGDSWRIKFEFQEEIDSSTLERGCYFGLMVECNGFLFLWTSGPEIIYGFSIEVDCIKPVRIAPLPRQLVEDTIKGSDHIVAYGSSVLLVLPVTSKRTCNMVEGMIIWELFQDDEDKLLWKWREFARMSPASLTPYFGRGRWFYMCIAVGDYLCFGIVERDMRRNKVAAYNLKEGSWQFLPQCGGQTITEMLSFDPKLIFPQILL